MLHAPIQSAINFFKIYLKEALINPDCSTIKDRLEEARELLPRAGPFQQELETIIFELEQLDRICSIPAKDEDDGSDCGV